MAICGSPLSRAISVQSIVQTGMAVRKRGAAVVCLERQLDWRELDAITLRAAQNYLALGLEPGDRIASFMPNGIALLIHYLACLRAGLVATPLNYRYTPAEIDHALEVSGARILIAHADRDADVSASNRVSRLPLGTLRYGGKDGSPLSWEHTVAQQAGDIQMPTLDPDAPAMIYFTSGSTGKPKGVTHTVATLGWMIASTIAGLELSASDVVVPGTSHSHIGGSLLALAALAAGSTVVVPRTIDGGELLPLFRQFQPTFLCMLPAALFALVRDHGATPADFQSLRLCISGGDKVSAELEKEFTELTGFAIDETYGMTEIGFATGNPPQGENRIGSIGKPLPGYEFEIRDSAGKALPPTQEGRLWVRSPTNTIGYWENRQATDETIQDGWLDTGDIMSADADDYLWFHGRQKQIIVHDGSNICPQEVEESLLAHPAVAGAGVIGIHNLVHGEIVRAYVEVHAGLPRPGSEELIQFSRARVGYKAPEEIFFMESLPLNATGKIDRVALKQFAERAHTAG